MSNVATTSIASNYLEGNQERAGYEDMVLMQFGLMIKIIILKINYNGNDHELDHDNITPEVSIKGHKS